VPRFRVCYTPEERGAEIDKKLSWTAINHLLPIEDKGERADNEDMDARSVTNTRQFPVSCRKLGTKDLEPDMKRGKR